jgi:predicted Fe-Mo cluster-binding NifX family protein
MKIALPSRQDQIESHFGHCEYFTVFSTDDKDILSQEVVASPTGCGCKSNIAVILADMGVKLMLAGNMGDGAVNVLNNAGIEVVRGCSGNVKEVTLAWLAGSVTGSGDSCHEHEHCCQHYKFYRMSLLVADILVCLYRGESLSIKCRYSDIIS